MVYVGIVWAFIPWLVFGFTFTFQHRIKRWLGEEVKDESR